MNKKNVKRVAIIAVILVCFFVAFLVKSVGDTERIMKDPTLVVVNKSQYLLLSSAENNVETEANAVKNNLRVIYGDETVEFEQQTISNDSATFIDNETSIKLSVFGLLNGEGERSYTVSHEETNQAVNGVMFVRYTDSLDEELEEQAGNADGSQGEHKGHYIKEEAHAAQQRYVEGVADNFVIDGVADEAISGTVEGERVIESDPYLERDIDGTIDKNSELEQQEVIIVDKPLVVQPEEHLPQVEEQPIQPSQPTIEEGYVEPEIEVQPEAETPVEVPTEPEQETQPEEASPITTTYSQLVVINEAQEAVGTYWGNGSERKVATVEEANVVDNGDGTVTTAFGIFTK